MTTPKQKWVAELLSKFQGETAGDAAPVLNAVIESICEPLNEIDDALNYLLTMRSLDTAEGIWLDNLGDILGLPRPSELESADNIFTYGYVYFYFAAATDPTVSLIATPGAELSLVSLETGTSDSLVATGSWQDLSVVGSGTYGIFGNRSDVTSLDMTEANATYIAANMLFWFPALTYYTGPIGVYNSDQLSVFFDSFSDGFTGVTDLVGTGVETWGS